MSRKLAGAGVRAPVLVLMIVALVALPGAAGAAPPAPASQRLAERYSPIVVLRRHEGGCAGTGEPFVPMAVDPLLGNRAVALRQVGNGDPVIMWGPTARDLYGLGEGVYLDFPGDSLQPGCVFESDGARYSAGRPPVVYAHIARQPDRPEYLAVQYWLYWYYNDWNNKHESDWEFVQVVFRASSVDQALTVQPESVGFAQHEGGERSPWTSDPLERDGSHPVVYASERSHASYPESALFLGRSASEGFGCDNTEAPSVRTRPQAVVLPDRPSGPDDPFAWLAFDGRWGERHPDPNNGPTGPATKAAWSAPVDWQESLRSESLAIPGGSVAGPAVVGAFCTVVGRGSSAFVGFVASPVRVLAGLTLVGLLLGFLLRRTSWRRVDPLPVVARRRAGEIVRASMGLYRQRFAAVAPLGLVAAPIALSAVVVGAVLQHIPLFHSVATISTTSGIGNRLLVSSFAASVSWPLTAVVVTALVARLLAPPADRRAQPAAPLAGVGDLASSVLLAAVVVGALSLTVAGLPVAVFLAVRYLFSPQVAMLENLGGRRALARSSALVRRRGLHTALVAVLVWAGVEGLALALGLLMLIAVPGLPLWTVSAAVVACQAAITPAGAICLTLLYGDARAAHDAKQQLTRQG